MDSNLKRSAILVTVLICLTVITVVLLANAKQLKKNTSSEVSDIQASAGISASVQKQQHEPDQNGFVQIGDDNEAWKKDKGFFDSEESNFAALIFERMNTLSIKAVSVEKNMRVQIVDFEGNSVTGVEFNIQIRNLSDGKTCVYSDTDMDGRIVVEDLIPGNYEVSLEACEDYILPEKPLKVFVKESVEYLMIEDISFQIAGSEEAAFQREDLMEISATENAPKKQNSSYSRNDNLTYGIDISEHNGEIDWNKVYESGIRFVMLRAGYRGAESGQIISDSSFYDNAKAAYRAGLDVGAYFYSQAVSEVEAVEEASALLLWCSDLNVDFPLTIRFDRAGGLGRADEITEDQRSLVAEAFCETVKNAGYVAGIYATSQWIDTNLNSGLLSKYNFWLADYQKTPTYEGWYDMWQFSSVGKVPGVEGQVCLSLIYNN